MIIFIEVFPLFFFVGGRRLYNKKSYEKNPQGKNCDYKEKVPEVSRMFGVNTTPQETIALSLYTNYF